MNRMMIITMLRKSQLAPVNTAMTMQASRECRKLITMRRAY